MHLFDVPIYKGLSVFVFCLFAVSFLFTACTLLLDGWSPDATFKGSDYW